MQSLANCRASKKGSSIKKSEVAHNQTVKNSDIKKAEPWLEESKGQNYFRIVLRGIPHSVSTDIIKNALKDKGYDVGCITNIISERKNKPFPLFYVDLVPNKNSFNIFNLNNQYLLQYKITVEEPVKNNFGYTKEYCNLPPKSVRPVKSHDPSPSPSLQNLAKCEVRGTTNTLTEGIPKENNIKINNMKTVKDAEVLIRLKFEEDMKRTLNNNDIKSGQLKASGPQNKQPKVIMYEVPVYIKEKDISENVYYYNKDYIGLEKKDFIAGFNPLFKVGPRDKETIHWVISCSPRVRMAIVNKYRLDIGCGSCRVKDYLSASRCSKCQSYGHVAKYCKIYICAYCSGKGHDIKQCNRIAGRPTCVNCKAIGKSFDHKANDPNCPCHLKALQQEISKTNYGYS